MATFKRRKKTCYFTDNKIQKIDWKDVDLLKKFISDRGKILPRRITGTKAIYQRELAVAIKNARFMTSIADLNVYHEIANGYDNLYKCEKT